MRLSHITANQNPVQLLDKLKDYKDGEERILCGLKHEFGVTGVWSVQPWLFVWEKLKEPLRSQINKFEVKTTYLNNVLGPPIPGIDAVRKNWGQSPIELATLLPEERQRYLSRPSSQP